MEIMEDAVVVGAGIAGLATAVALRRAGIKALVLERSEGLRATGSAVTLLPNAWLALDALGVSHKLKPFYTSIKKRCFTNLDTGEFQEINLEVTNGDRPRTIHRRALLEALAEELPTNYFRFSSMITAIETEAHEGSSIAIIHLEDGTIIRAKALIGCDGIHSAVARWMGLAAPVHSGRSALRGLAVFPQPHGLKHESHLFGGGGRKAGFIPLTDKDVYWFFSSATPVSDHPTGDPKAMQRDVLDNHAKDFSETYADIVSHTDLSTLSWAPLMFRQPWNIAFGSLSKLNVTVAGDAMHPMTPDLAQGGCAALEDAVVLGRHIGTAYIQDGQLVPSKVARALASYAEERRWRAAWLVAGSWLTWWVQQGDSRWHVKLFRDVIFNRFLRRRIAGVVHYDCGKLPSFDASEEQDKMK